MAYKNGLSIQYIFYTFLPSSLSDPNRCCWKHSFAGEVRPPSGRTHPTDVVTHDFTCCVVSLGAVGLKVGRNRHTGERNCFPSGLRRMKRQSKRLSRNGLGGDQWTISSKPTSWRPGPPAQLSACSLSTYFTCKSVGIESAYVRILRKLGSSKRWLRQLASANHSDSGERGLPWIAEPSLPLVRPGESRAHG